jgi:hypothetical protein
LAAKFRPNYFNWRQNYSPIRLSWRQYFMSVPSAVCTKSEP